MSSQPDSEPLTGEVVEPKEGSLAWLEQQPTVLIDGLGPIPVGHRLKLDDGGTLMLGEDDGRCRYVKPDGVRCGAARMHRYGICVVHAGGGAGDMSRIGKLGGQAKARLRMNRQLLGISHARTADPRQALRLAALASAQTLADAALAPLHDPDLGSLARHGAALRILDATFPQEQVTVSVDLPADEAGVQALSWQDMQALATQLLAPHSDHTVELEGA